MEKERKRLEKLAAKKAKREAKREAEELAELERLTNLMLHQRKIRKNNSDYPNI